MYPSLYECSIDITILSPLINRRTDIPIQNISVLIDRLKRLKMYCISVDEDEAKNNIVITLRELLDNIGVPFLANTNNSVLKRCIRVDKYDLKKV